MSTGHFFSHVFSAVEKVRKTVAGGSAVHVLTSVDVDIYLYIFVYIYCWYEVIKTNKVVFMFPIFIPLLGADRIGESII